MIAGADEPATLSGLCQPMAMAMVTVFAESIQGFRRCDALSRRGGRRQKRVFDDGGSPVTGAVRGAAASESVSGERTQRSGRQKREASRQAKTLRCGDERHGRQWVIFSAFQWKMGGRGGQNRTAEARVESEPAAPEV
ncbi:hypothetical protein CCMA1212_000933 [Trichoderma ghanense]|uniref:Uncharacterized protein n=1 Tax=Trichoderma ghanense TaxID=65468 RepID=A0ABY2HGT5_9HYPO